jgi:hypothetical protein
MSKNKKALKIINTKSETDTKFPLVLQVKKNTLEAMTIYLDNNLVDIDELFKHYMNSKMEFIKKVL